MFGLHLVLVALQGGLQLVLRKAIELVTPNTIFVLI